MIELLIVVAIIGVVASLLFPAAQKSIESVRRAKCVSNLRQIGAAIQLYRNDCNNTYPPANGAATMKQVIGWYGLWYTPSVPVDGGLVPYVGSLEALNKLVVCPRNGYPDSNRPSIKSPYGYPYVVNYNVLVQNGVAKPKSHLELSRPSEVFLMTDSATGETPDTAWRLGLLKKDNGWEALEDRHSNQMNILWADGHVSSGPKETSILSANFIN